MNGREKKALTFREKGMKDNKNIEMEREKQYNLCWFLFLLLLFLTQLYETSGWLDQLNSSTV